MLSFPSLSTAFTKTFPLNVSVSVYPEETVVQVEPPSFEYLYSLTPEPSTVIPPHEVLSVAEKDTITLDPVQVLPSYLAPFAVIVTTGLVGLLISLTVTLVTAVKPP